MKAGLLERAGKLKVAWEREVELAEAMGIGSLTQAIKDYASWRDPYLVRVDGRPCIGVLGLVALNTRVEQARTDLGQLVALEWEDLNFDFRGAMIAEGLSRVATAPADYASLPILSDAVATWMELEAAVVECEEEMRVAVKLGIDVSVERPKNELGRFILCCSRMNEGRFEITKEGAKYGIRLVTWNQACVRKKIAWVAHVNRTID